MKTLKIIGILCILVYTACEEEPSRLENTFETGLRVNSAQTDSLQECIEKQVEIQFQKSI